MPLLAVLLAACAPVAPGVEDAWVRTPPPGASTAAAYFVLTNGPAATALVGVRSPQFGSAMIHETRTEDGTTRMTEVEPLSMEAGERLVFAPGALHVMLMQPDRQLQRGERIDIELAFANGERLRFAAAVRDDAP